MLSFVLHFSTRFACKRDLHLNSILNSYAGCNTHQPARDAGVAPEGGVYVCVCTKSFEVCFARFHCALMPLFWHFTSFLQWISVESQLRLVASCVCLSVSVCVCVCVRLCLFVINCYTTACTFMFHSCT